jgi:hypothetical protein
MAKAASEHETDTPGAMTRAELKRAIERKDLDLDDRGGLARVCFEIFVKAGARGMTFPEIAEILFSDQYDLDKCEDIGFALEKIMCPPD